MNTIKMKMTKTEAGRQVATMIHEEALSPGMSATWGINEDGDIEMWRNVHGFEGMVVELFNNDGGYDGLGCDAYPEEWDDSDIEAYGAMFSDSWIDDSISATNDVCYDDESCVDIIWP